MWAKERDGEAESAVVRIAAGQRIASRANYSPPAVIEIEPDEPQPAHRFVRRGTLGNAAGHSNRFERFVIRVEVNL
jgi:hypothetical protein